jgi:uncharacterized protein YqjF (DUF2071 family)
MRQEWHELLFAHWPLPAGGIAPLLPRGLSLDMYEGQAWVGIVPFRMVGIRVRGMVPLPWLSAFPELNLRTYVSIDGKPGVFFFSLDAANPVAVRLARRFFALPYYDALMQSIRRGDTILYTSSRRKTASSTKADLDWAYRPTASAGFTTPGSLEYWLTERYCLYSANRHGELFRGEIHHLPWRLQPAEVERKTTSVAHPFGIVLPEIEPLLHYSERQEVLVWSLETVSMSRSGFISNTK